MSKSLENSFLCSFAYYLTMTPHFVILVCFKFLDFPSKSPTMPNDTKVNKGRTINLLKFQILLTFYALPFDLVALCDEGKIISTKYPVSVSIVTLSFKSPEQQFSVSFFLFSCFHLSSTSSILLPSVITTLLSLAMSSLIFISFLLQSNNFHSYDSDLGLRNTGQVSPFLKSPRLDPQAHQNLRSTVLETGPPTEPFPHSWTRDTL